MPKKLYLYVQGKDQLEWVMDSQGHYSEAESGGWSALGDFISNQSSEGISTYIIFSSVLASHVTTQLSPKQLKFVKKALPFALEDKVAEDSSKMHITMASHHKNGQVSAWMLESKLVSSVQDSVEQLSLSLEAAYVDADLLVVSSGEENQMLLVDEDRILFSTADTKLSASKTWLPSISDRVSLSQPIKLYCPQAYSEADILSHQVASLFDVEVEQVSYQGSALFQLIQKLDANRGRAVKILTGRKSADPKLIRSIWQTSVVAVFALVIFLVSQMAEINRINSEVDQYAKSIELICKDIFGQNKQCREALLKREVTGLLNRDANTGSEKGFIDLLRIISEPISEDITLDSIRYEQSRDELLVALKGNSFQTLENYKEQVIRAGLDVTLSASQQSDHTKGSLKVNLGGNQ